MDKEEYLFRELQISDRSVIEKICALNGGTLYSHTFHVMFLWRDFWKLTVCIDEDFFVARATIDGREAYFFPCGNEDKKIKFLRWFVREKADDCTLCNISYEDKVFLEKHVGNALSLELSRKDFAYIYDKNEQLEMSGKKYRNLRGSLKKSARGHEWYAEPVDLSNIDDVKLIAERWFNTHDDSYDTRPMKLAVDNFFDLGMFGVVLYCDDRPCAFALGSYTNENTFDLNISDTLMPHIDLLLRYELFRLLPDNILYVDQEDDMGIEGLRTHKTVLKPCRMDEAWVYVPPTLQ